jgi:hypothetical protein
VRRPARPPPCDVTEQRIGRCDGCRPSPTFTFNDGAFPLAIPRTGAIRHDRHGGNGVAPRWRTVAVTAMARPAEAEAEAERDGNVERQRVSALRVGGGPEMSGSGAPCGRPPLSLSVAGPPPAWES